MKESKSRKNRRLIGFKNSILMLVTLVCIFLSVWAWFSVSGDSEATGLTLKSKTAGGLEFAWPTASKGFPTNGNDYSPELNFSDITTELTADVTGDGINLIIPMTHMESGVRVVDADNTSNKAWVSARDKADSEGPPDYACVDFYVRSENPNIAVTGESKVTADLPDTKVNTGTDKIDESGDPFKYFRIKRTGGVDGRDDTNTEVDVTRNAIMGALRVSVLDITDELNEDCSINASYKPQESNRKLLWIPRPDLLLEAPLQASKPWYVKTGQTSGESYVHSYYYPKNLNEVAQGINLITLDADKTVTSVIDGTTGDVKLGSSHQVAGGSVGSVTRTATFASDPGKTYYIYKFRMNIWIEGQDAEARRALNQGQFNLSVFFSNMM